MLKSKSSNSTMETDASSGGHTIIGKGMELTGNLKSNSDIRVDGFIQGNLETSGRIVVGQSGKIDGNLVARSADVLGNIKGSIITKELLSLKNSAKIDGDIVCAKLSVETEAQLNGTITMGAKNSITETKKALEDAK